ncbi:MAG TPA: methionyl-tRNA formyltransferase [Myxococcaceae bacterium]|nr:methionyl-tRNA formyltransferase [Myxococcaceae bacterium]
MAEQGRAAPLRGSDGVPLVRGAEQGGAARIAFFGTPPFAVPALRACQAVGTVVAVVTQPDRPRGRGQHVTPSAVKAEAEKAGVPVLQPPKLKGTDFGERLRAMQLDAAVVAAYGRILPAEVLSAPRLGCLNVHASLLPRWRGAAPIQWAIASGDPETGVCLMQMEAGLDTGPVLALRRTPILAGDTSESLHARLSELGGALLREELPRFLAGMLTPCPQPAEGVTIARLVEKEDGRLDWTRPAVELERRVRAFVPWPGGWTQLGQQLLKVWRAEAVPGSGPPGTVLAAHGTLDVACGQGALRLVEVQPEGKRRMTAAEFLSGHRLREGERPFEGGVP